jgi:hypothetical protein
VTVNPLMHSAAAISEPMNPPPITSADLPSTAAARNRR